MLAHELVRRKDEGGTGGERGPAAAAGEAGDWIYFLHGIFGSGRNWRSVARRWVDRRPGRGAVLVDLRLHGDSTAFFPPHTIRACADDVERLAVALERPTAGILGHSFGGKVALMLAARAPAGLESVWIIDSTPAPRDPQGSAVRMLDALRSEPGPFDSREAGERALERHGFPRAVARWMGTNLSRDAEGRWRWRLDLDGIEALLSDFFRTDLWGVVEAPPAGVTLHFVKATDSAVLRPADCERIEAAGEATGRVRLHRVRGGHWLNVDAPEAVLALLEGNARAESSAEG